MTLRMGGELVFIVILVSSFEYSVKVNSVSSSSRVSFLIRFSSSRFDMVLCFYIVF